LSDSSISRRQTADTFDAAATFLSLAAIWGPPDNETQQKIKFAKWNATRILKAIKEGKDPNESNPKQDERGPDAALPSLDPNDPEVQLLSNPSAGMTPRAVSVEDVPDSGYAPAAMSPYMQAPVPLPHPQTQGYFDPPQPSPLSPGYQQPSTAPAPEVSPQLPPMVPAREVSPQLPPQLPPKAAAMESRPQPIPMAPSPFSPANVGPPPPVQAQHSPWATPNIQDSHYYQAPSPNVGPLPMHHAQGSQYMHPSAPAPPQQPAWQPPRAAVGAPLPTVDERNILQAQKHAKWAVSALNFDDVPTAVKELRSALAALGVRQ
jgi:vacuolar protein sorting-associated protein VTA1